VRFRDDEAVDVAALEGRARRRHEGAAVALDERLERGREGGVTDEPREVDDPVVQDRPEPPPAPLLEGDEPHGEGADRTPADLRFR
jgi:hypothetical protein